VTYSPSSGSYRATSESKGRSRVASGAPRAETASPDAIVIGDGIGGLACAHYLLKAGLVPLVVCIPEPGHEQLRFFEFDGLRIDAFHRPIRPSDSALRGLLSDLGYDHRVHWRNVRHRTHPDPAARWSLRARARLARALLRPSGRAEVAFDRQQAHRTLPLLAGARAYHELLEPPLEALLGLGLDANIPAASLRWALAEAYPSGLNQRGHVRGGWFEYALELRRSIADRGGCFLTPDSTTRLRLEKDGISLEGDHTFHAPLGLSCVPWMDLSALCQGVPIATEVPEGRRLDVVSVCIIARPGENGAYSHTMQGASAAFPLYVQADRLLPERETAGRRLFYMTRRFATGSLRVPDEVLAKQAVESLCRAQPEFLTTEIEDVRVHMSVGAEYLPERESHAAQSTRRISCDVPLFESSCFQRHPRPPGFETAVLMARDAASVLRRELA